MTLRWLFASLHLLALPMGFSAVWMRARALSGTINREKLQRAFLADAFWGLAAVFWIVTGLIRVFGPYEKGSEYYLASDAFLAKMFAFALIMILELWPMVTLIRWRALVRRGTLPEPGPAQSIARISFIQAGLVLIMVFAATAIARGYLFGS